MKVNVTFSIDLKDIPKEIRKKLSSLKEENINDYIEGICINLDDNIVDTDVFGMLEEAQKKYLDIADKLSQYHYILAEYQKAMAELQLSKHQESLEQEPQKETQENVEENN